MKNTKKKLGVSEADKGQAQFETGLVSLGSS